MAQAKELIETFWELQDDNDYGKLIPLFADDAVLKIPRSAGSRASRRFPRCCTG